MQADVVHQLVHDERGPGHVPAVLKQRDREEEQHDLRHEDQHAAHPADDAVHDQRLKRPVGQHACHHVAQRHEAALQPAHRRRPEAEDQLKHRPHQHQEDRDAQHPAGHDLIDPLRPVHRGRSGARHRLRAGSVDEAVAAIGQRKLSIIADDRLQVRPHPPDALQQVLAARDVALNVRAHLLIVLEQLQRHPARGHAREPARSVHDLRDLADVALKLPPVAHIARREPSLARNRDRDLQQVLHALGLAGHRSDHRHAEQCAEQLSVDRAAHRFGHVHHVQRDDDRHAKLDELRGQVEVALEVRGVHDVNDHVGPLVNDEVARDDFLE